MRTQLTLWTDRIFGRSTPAVASAISRRMVLQILAFFAVWRLSILAISMLWGEQIIITRWPSDIDVMWLWRYSVRWDAGWYLTIAEHGYSYHPDYASSVAFFPLYPLLIRLTDFLLPGTTVMAALIVSNVALVAALFYIYRLFRMDYGKSIAWRSLYFLLIFPSAFFFSAVYNESLFLLTIAGSLYYARKGRWWLAGGFAVAAGATKLVGVMLVIPLAVEMITQRAIDWRRPWTVLPLVIAPAGALTYFAWLQVEFGSYRVFFDTEEHWFRESFSPVMFMGIDRLLGDTSHLIYYPANSSPLRTVFLLFDTTLFWLFLAAGIILWVKYRPSYGALVLVFAIVPAFSGSPQSLNRYLAILFPAALILGSIKSEAVRQGLSVLFVMGLAFTTWLFINGLWAG